MGDRYLEIIKCPTTNKDMKRCAGCSIWRWIGEDDYNECDDCPHIFCDNCFITHVRIRFICNKDFFKESVKLFNDELKEMITNIGKEDKNIFPQFFKDCRKIVLERVKDEKKQVQIITGLIIRDIEFQTYINLGMEEEAQNIVIDFFT